MNLPIWSYPKKKHSTTEIKKVKKTYQPSSRLLIKPYKIYGKRTIKSHLENIHVK